MRFVRLLVLGLVLSSPAAAQTVQQQPGLVRPIAPGFSAKLLPAVEGYDYSTPLALGEDGAVTGYAATEPFSPFAEPILVDERGALTVLANDDPTFGMARGQSGDGLIAGRYGLQPRLWIDGAPVTLGAPDGWFSGTAMDVNTSGLVAGSFGDFDFNGGQHCVWKDAANPALVLKGVLPPSTLGVATAVNEKGMIAGTSGFASGTFFAVLWMHASANPIQIGPLPGAQNSDGLDMNERGDVVGRSSTPSELETEAFLYLARRNTILGLGFLPGGGPYSEALGVNDARWVVGSANAGPGVAHAFLWIDGVLYDLNDLLVASDPSILYLQSAIAVNENGQIAAEAVVGPFPEARIALLDLVHF